MIKINCRSVVKTAHAQFSYISNLVFIKSRRKSSPFSKRGLGGFLGRAVIKSLEQYLSFILC